MHRALLAGCLAALVWGFGSQFACAQEQVTAVMQQDIVSVAQGWDQYLQDDIVDVLLNALKVVLLVGLYLTWVTSTDWVNRDRFERKVGKGWNL
ncbi:MAG TPA: hypothetical protein VHC19_29865, partial [Pirellulales bacterium]|nr:hypothetical protein [Pirellulales bacterium]